MAEDEAPMDVEETPVEEEAEIDQQQALRVVLRNALVNDGLRRGLHESAKALDRHAAHLCVLAKDCDSEEFTTLVMALCKEADIPLLFAQTREELGELVGLAKTDKEGNVKGKIQKCSVAVVTEWGEESRELHKLKEYLQK